MAYRNAGDSILFLTFYAVISFFREGYSEDERLINSPRRVAFRRQTPPLPPPPASVTLIESFTGLELLAY